jgi:hypothetical protein
VNDGSPVDNREDVVPDKQIEFGDRNLYLNCSMCAKYGRFVIMILERMSLHISVLFYSDK